MNYIILDLEFNCPCKINTITHKIEKGYVNPKIQFEIIEIGAIKFDSNFNMVDTFRIFVRPQVYKVLHPKVKRLTKITKEDLKYAHTLEQSINYFRKWIKDNIVFCSWGKSDFIVLKNNCEFYNIDTNWIKNYIDIQNIYVIKYELKNLVSLRNIVKLLEIENDKKFHKALNDAFYTGEIMKKLNIEDVSKYFIE